MKGFNPLAALIQEFRSFKTAVLEKLDAIIVEQKEQRKLLNQHTELLNQHTELLNQHTELLNQLIAEVSRYKNDSEELLVSVYGYCTQERIPFTHGDLFKWGGLATRMSRRMGAKVVKTNDPRFGEVNLYERHILDNVIED